MPNPCERIGCPGFTFAPGHPTARSGGAARDFQTLDGRHIRMQKRLWRIWELFIPPLAVGTSSTNNEVRSPRGALLQKATPNGFSA